MHTSFDDEVGISRPKYQSLIEEVSKGFFMNEDVSETSWRRLGAKEKAENTAAATICSLNSLLREDTPSLRDAVKRGENAPTVDGTSYQPSSSLNNVYFNKVLASRGDIRKCPNYQNNTVLISYATETVHRNKRTKESATFLSKISVLEQALAQMVRYAPQFEKAIAEESRDEKEEKKRVITQYFLNLVVAIDVGVDVLYSSCIRADIDYNVRPAVVQSVNFECKSTDFLEEHLTVIHYFNSLAVSGKLNQVLDARNHDALLMARDRILGEKTNLMDIAFTLITTNKWTDLLLLPIYLIRSVVYMVKYLTAGYSRITFSFGKSLEMMKKSRVTAEEFKAYSGDAQKKASALEQASRKSAIDVSEDIRSSKNEIKEIEQAVKSGGEQSSVLI